MNSMVMNSISIKKKKTLLGVYESILLIPVAPLSVCVCLCVCVCVTYLLWNHWTDLVHIWGDDRYNTDEWPRLGLVTLGQRSRSPGRSRSSRKKIFLNVREIWRAAEKTFLRRFRKNNLAPIFFQGHRDFFFFFSTIGLSSYTLIFTTRKLSLVGF